LSADARILIVDDDGLIRILLRHMLAKCGFANLGEAADGFQALSMLAEGSYKLVLLDINLPGISGLEVCSRIQQDWPRVRVILMSGSVADWRPLMRTGASAYLDKPLSMRDLDLTVRRVLAERDGSPPTGRDTRWLPT
jgi:CheY-like chemotaxis protein